MIVRSLCAVGLSVFLGCSAIGVFYAQQPAAGTFDFEPAREPVVVLDGLWRFHPGDDPRWAQPGFDDSGWAAIRGDKSWDAQGYKGLSGYAWYRARIVLPAGAKPLSLYIPYVITDFQVFADGTRLQSCGAGRMDAWAVNVPVVCDLPRRAPGAGKTLTLAIRVWHWSFVAPYVGGGMWSPPLIGQRQPVYARRLTVVHAMSWGQVGRIVIATLTLVSSIAALLLFLFRQDQREYLWFGIMAAMDATGSMINIHLSLRSYINLWAYVPFAAVTPADSIAAMLFFTYFLRARRDWLFWLGVAGTVSGLLLIPLAIGDRVSLPAWDMLFVLANLPGTAWILALVIRRVIEGDMDGRLIIGPVVLGYMSVLISDATIILSYTGLYRGQADWLYSTVTWPFPFSFSDVSELLFLLAMLGVLIYRFIRSSAHEERMAGELSAANAVQHILIPEEVPELPGFAIESVYRPANEVGGDFFQILPTSSGGVLAVIGDVSGKGMPAAMIVSLLVGTLRTLAEGTDSPAELLDGLNRRLIGRSSGFTTCLILRADRDGTCVVANAGHLPLYVDGREAEVETGLPLGISAEASYEETRLHLDEGVRLTLFTDGVVEARSRTGELYGFDRAGAVAGAAAAQIAAEAQAFGQEDDITVVSVTRAVSLEPMAV
ncbi:MAG TPA: SpoIIE family protein phosphatase [Acidobacteriaceae bacterium]|nr:SpoIIE family protein phosphatase [Acidobacteriaceae bacterium]